MSSDEPKEEEQEFCNAISQLFELVSKAIGRAVLRRRTEQTNLSAELVPLPEDCANSPNN